MSPPAVYARAFRSMRSLPTNGQAFLELKGTKLGINTLSKRSTKANSYSLATFTACDTPLNYRERSRLAFCFSCSLTWKPCLKLIQVTSLLFSHLFWKHQDIFVHFTSPFASTLLVSTFLFPSLLLFTV